jgi:hypothetical protein
MKLLKDNNEYMLIDSSRNLIATTDESIIKASPKKHKLSRQNCMEIFDEVDVEDLGSQYAWQFVKEKGLSKHNMAKQSFIEGFNKAKELNKDKLFTIDDILVAMICMQGQEVFYEKTFEETEENRKLYIENYIKHLQKTELDVEMLYNRDCYSSAGWCDKLTMAQCIMCTPVYPLKDDNDCIILKKL